MIDQLFRWAIYVGAPKEIEDAINQFLPNKEQVQKKQRMHRDLWFFKDHSSKTGNTSYWTYHSGGEPSVQDPRIWREITECDGEVVYCNEFNLRDTHCMFASGFLTWKDELYCDSSLYNEREPYEKLLFDEDGEETEEFRVLNSTEDFIYADEGESNRGVFLGLPGDQYGRWGAEHPSGISVLNIISKAIDGIYRIRWSTSGFGSDDTGDYENKVITIYNSPAEQPMERCHGSDLRKYIEAEYDKWSLDPGGRYTGLIIGDRDSDPCAADLMGRTSKHSKFFSIFLKPDCKHITGGYWGYMRDELVIDNDGNTQLIDGPRHMESMWRNKV